VGARESEGDSQMRDVAIQMVKAMQATPAEAAAQWAGIVATLCGQRGGAILQAATPGVVTKPEGIPRPDWCARAEDKRHALHWDTSQTVMNVLVGGQHALAILDTGSYKTILDVGMARILNLPVRYAVNGDCGTYQVPGTGQSNCYAGMVEGPVEI
jgi:hypothetical protein